MKTLAELLEGKPIWPLRQNFTVQEAACHMASKKIGAVPVVEGTRLRLVGVFSERDLVTRVVARGLDPSTTTIGQVMTRDVIIAYPNETCEVALERMMRAHIRHLPVVSAGHLAGFVSFRDLVLRDVAAKEGALQMMSSAVHLTGSAAGGIPPMWKCHSCGHLAHGEAPPDRCPACAARHDQFALLKES